MFLFYICILCMTYSNTIYCMKKKYIYKFYMYIVIVSVHYYLLGIMYYYVITIELLMPINFYWIPTVCPQGLYYNHTKTWLREIEKYWMKWKIERNGESLPNHQSTRLVWNSQVSYYYVKSIINKSQLDYGIQYSNQIHWNNWFSVKAVMSLSWHLSNPFP